MRPETRLDSAVFQLTPTRTRCDLVVIANGRKEKIASGLLNPFVAHLKVAQQQIAKGGYSITLEVDPEIDAPWFTRGTVERLVLCFGWIVFADSSCHCQVVVICMVGFWQVCPFRQYTRGPGTSNDYRV
jgi:hypothetical protein